ncbi:hypothetical protein Tco_0978012 [Tanacetum coccineum]|uniref:Uncharacterized protein n=1 Tax=Tanacetum coccineum TaxID=301880 RepID=A0ABQ5ELR9_9ASTR
MQKIILKQQYKNFAASRSKGLDKTYDRFQKLISQLEIHGEVYEYEIKGQSSSNSQNVAFLSSKNTSSTNEAVNTAHEVSTASSQGQVSSSTYADDVMFSFFANQSNSGNAYHKGEKILKEDRKESDFQWAPGNQGNRNGDAPRRVVPVEIPTNTLVVQDGIGGYDWSFQAEEGITNFALMAYTSQGSSSSSSLDSENETVYEEDISFLKYDVQVKDISIKDLKNQLEEDLKEKDDLKLKLEKFEESLKNLTKLINSQISAKDKAGLGYDSQMNESEVVHSVFNSRESDVDNSPVNDRFKTGEGFHAVPPPYTGNYMPSRPDLSFAGLDDSVYKTKVSETETSISKTSKDIVEKPKTVRPSAPIIEDWDTDSDNDSVFRPKTDQTKPMFTKINFVKSDENVKSVNKENTHKQVKYPRKSQSPRGNRRNWNGMMTQKLGNGFEFIKKACFVCGSFNHLIKDCDFHDNKMVEKPVLNNKGRVTGQREIRPVWNTVQRVNDQNKLTHPHPKRNFVPTAFATKVNNVTTVGRKAVVSASVGYGENTVKSSACWIWRPTGNVIDHTSNDSGSYMFKRFDCVDLQGRLNGCSRHMTGNKSFLTDYQEVDGGFVAFTGSLRGCVMQRDDGIFISQDKYVVDILKKFDFVTMKTSSTPIETHKALLKDEEAENVDVHLYRSMIRSLMYLTASRPDIMFAVCTCARFQVTPKVSHLHADYTGASLDRKSSIGGCQFLGKRLILWQCKKQTIVANSTTEAEYVAAANWSISFSIDNRCMNIEIKGNQASSSNFLEFHNWTLKSEQIDMMILKSGSHMEGDHATIAGEKDFLKKDRKEFLELLMAKKWHQEIREGGNRNGDAPRRNAPVDTSTTNGLVVQDGYVVMIGAFRLKKASQTLL